MIGRHTFILHTNHSTLLLPAAGSFGKQFLDFITVVTQNGMYKLLFPVIARQSVVVTLPMPFASP